MNNSIVQVEAIEKIYSYTLINSTFVVLYLLGIFSCFGLALVIWFEKSGQAGPYRTVINQLVSCRLEQVILAYAVCGIFILRILTGPLPWILCETANFLVHMMGVNIILFSLACTIFRFMIVIVYRSIPVMNDELLVRITVRITYTASILTVGVRDFLQTYKAVTALCTGIENKPQNDYFVPSVTVLSFLILVVGFFLNFVIYLKRPKDPVLPFNHQNGTVMSLDSFLIVALATSFSIIGALAFHILK